MGSVRVRYFDAEVTVTIPTPNTSMKEVLEKAKEALGLPSAKTNLEMRYRQKPLDLLLPFRLTGILNNSTLNLVDIVTRFASDQEATISLGVIIDGGKSRVEGTFTPSTKIIDVLKQLCPHLQFEAIRFVNKRMLPSEFDQSLRLLGLTSGSGIIYAYTEAPQSIRAPSPSPETPTDSMEIELSPTPKHSLQIEIPNDSECKVAIITLMKLLRNIYINPTEEKVRNVRTTNPAIKSKLKDSKAAYEFLFDAGFEQISKDGDVFLVMNNVDIIKLRSAYSRLEKLCDDLCVPPTERPSLDDAPTPTARAPVTSTKPTEFQFDPFKTNVIGLNGGGPSIRMEESGVYTLDQQVASLKQRRDTMMQSDSSVSDRRVVAIAYSSDFNPRSFRMEDDDEEEESDRGDYDQHARDVIAQHHKAVQERQRKAENFQTKAMRELDQLSKSKVYTRTLIRITFPDRSVLQALFSPLETVADVCKLISATCACDLSDFSLTVSPPPRRLEQNESLFALGLVPAASVIISTSRPEKMKIPEKLFSNDQELLNTRVPKGEYLLRTVAAAASRSTTLKKPKWLKL